MTEEKIKDNGPTGVDLIMALFLVAIAVTGSWFFITAKVEPTAEISGTVTRISDRVVMIDDDQTLLINSSNDHVCELLQVGDEVKITYGEKYMNTRNCEIVK